MSKTLKSYKNENTWIKIIDTDNFDYREYKKFYNFAGYQFLPELYDVEKIDSGLKLVMEFIGGKKPSIKYIDYIIRFISYKIIPSFIEWSLINNYKDVIYYPCDNKIDNMIITSEKKLYLIDIDSICKTDFVFFDDILNIIYKKNKRTSYWENKKTLDIT